jgi:hypothetical protein
MGIFGFLSKAHIDSTLEAGANSVEIRTLNQQEKIAKERLEYLLKRAGNPETASANVDKQIQQTQKELADISKRKLPLLKEENKLIAEVGPIKYIGDMVYGTEDTNAIDKAVRLVILLIMVVFDPLAVLLLIAANMSLQQRKDNIAKKEEIVTVVPDVPVFTEKKPDEEEVKEDRVEIPKNNITSIDASEQKEITIDPVSGETIPPLTVPVAPGVYMEFHEAEPVKKLEPKYDYEEEFAFKEKEKKAKQVKLDGGDF